MIEKYKKRTNIFIGIAFLVGVFLRPNTRGLIFIIFIIGDIILWVLGCYNYAKGKGYHGAWGALGVFPLVGAIVLIFFPDKNKVVK